jgi:hypothetical protein
VNQQFTASRTPSAADALVTQLSQVCRGSTRRTVVLRPNRWWVLSRPTGRVLVRVGGIRRIVARCHTVAGYGSDAMVGAVNDIGIYV